MAPPVAARTGISAAAAGLSLRANFSWTCLGQFVYGGCQWAMLAVLAKFGSAEMLGLFSLGLAVTAPFIIFSMLQLRSVQATDANYEFEFGHYLALRLGTSALALLLIALATRLAGYQGETALIILALGLFKAVEAISDVHYGLMQQRDRMDRIAIALLLKGPLFLLMLTAAIRVTGSILCGVLALIGCALAVLLCYERRSAVLLLRDRRAARPRWELRRLYALARLSFPLGIVMLLVALNANIPRYFVESWMGVRQLGYFTALIYPQTAGVMLTGALGQAATPRLARYFADNDRDAFVRLLSRMVLLGAVVSGLGVLAAAVLGRQILTLLYQADYADCQEAFVWLMLAAGLSFLVSFLGYGMTAARVFHAQVPLFAASAATGAAGCYLLIPGAGLVGAAKASVLLQLAALLGSATVMWAGVRRLDRRRSTECALTAAENEGEPTA